MENTKFSILQNTLGSFGANSGQSLAGQYFNKLKIQIRNTFLIIKWTVTTYLLFHYKPIFEFMPSSYISLASYITLFKKGCANRYCFVALNSMFTLLNFLQRNSKFETRKNENSKRQVKETMKYLTSVNVKAIEFVAYRIGNYYITVLLLDKIWNRE